MSRSVAQSLKDEIARAWPGLRIAIDRWSHDPSRWSVRVQSENQAATFVYSVSPIQVRERIEGIL